jgi:hypothetical protein
MGLYDMEWWDMGCWYNEKTDIELWYIGWWDMVWLDIGRRGMGKMFYWEKG